MSDPAIITRAQALVGPGVDTPLHICTGIQCMYT